MELPLSRLYKVSWADVAGSGSLARKSSHLSRSALVTIGMDSMERIFILETWAQRCPTDRFIDRIFANNTFYRPASFGLDATGPGGLIFYEQLQREKRERGAQINFKPVALHADKTFSIERTLQPVAAQGRLFRRPEDECRILKEEWTTFPDGQYKDILDALACAIRLLPSILPEHQRMMNRMQLERYLRRSGMDEQAVQLRLRQHDEANHERAI